MKLPAMDGLIIMTILQNRKILYNPQLMSPYNVESMLKTFSKVTGHKHNSSKELKNTHIYHTCSLFGYTTFYIFYYRFFLFYRASKTRGSSDEIRHILSLIFRRVRSVRPIILIVNSGRVRN